jgi:hypothetical protein
MGPDGGGSKFLETSMGIYQTTRRNVPEDGHIDTCRRENLKSQPCVADLLGLRQGEEAVLLEVGN